MYSNNKEYRQALRKFFQMNIESVKSKLDDREIYDDETYDEMLYDDHAAHIAIETIIKKTIDNTLFNTLYSLAAAKMISLDKETGLCILLSYDYFSDFYKLWCVYDSNPNNINNQSELYTNLYNRLS